MAAYIIYGMELSLFTRKLESAMIFYQAPFECKSKTAALRAELEHRSGTHQVPVLHTPENWMIADTTPIMMMLDGRFPPRALFPAGPLGVLVHIVEEYLDEWVARVMVHYCWHYADSTRFAIEKLTREMLADANEEEVRAAIDNAQIADWGRRACRATGTASEQQQRAAEAEYERLLDVIDQQLQQTRYLLGDRPCAVDTIVLGGLRAHTNMDPAPKRIVAGYPRIIQWCEQDADQWDGKGALVPFPESTPFAQTVLSRMQHTYKPFILANAKAQANKDKAFVVSMYGEDVSYLSRPYPERSRHMIMDRIAYQLHEEEKAVVSDWLEQIGLADCFR